MVSPDADVLLMPSSAFITFIAFTLIVISTFFFLPFTKCTSGSYKVEFLRVRETTWRRMVVRTFNAFFFLQIFFSFGISFSFFEIAC